MTNPHRLPITTLTGKAWTETKPHRGPLRYEFLPGREPLYTSVIAARLAGVRVERLHNWERWGLLDPARDQRNARFYCDAEIELAQEIRGLIDDAGLNLPGVVALLALRHTTTQHTVESDPPSI